MGRALPPCAGVDAKRKVSFSVSSSKAKRSLPSSSSHSSTEGTEPCDTMDAMDAAIAEIEEEELGHTKDAEPSVNPPTEHVSVP